MGYFPYSNLDKDWQKREKAEEKTNMDMLHTNALRSLKSDPLASEVEGTESQKEKSTMEERILKRLLLKRKSGLVSSAVLLFCRLSTRLHLSLHFSLTFYTELPYKAIRLFLHWETFPSDLSPSNLRRPLLRSKQLGFILYLSISICHFHSPWKLGSFC